MAYDVNEVQAYIREAAARRGIDPGTALRVIKQESGFNPTATNLSPKEKSYGLMQLNTQGGLGVHALEQGINIRDPNTWKQQLDFGLDVVAKDGWRQWYGARDVGIGRWDGIGGRPAGSAPVQTKPVNPGRAMSATPIAQQMMPDTGPAPAVFGDVVAPTPVQTTTVAPTSFGDLAQNFLVNQQVTQQAKRAEEAAEAERKAALFGSSLFGMYA